MAEAAVHTRGCSIPLLSFFRCGYPAGTVRLLSYSPSAPEAHKQNTVFRSFRTGDPPQSYSLDPDSPVPGSNAGPDPCSGPAVLLPCEADGCNPSPASVFRLESHISYRKRSFLSTGLYLASATCYLSFSGNFTVP